MDIRAIVAILLLVLGLAACGDGEVEPVVSGEETEQALDETGEAVERELSGASAEVEAEGEAIDEAIAEGEGPIDALEEAHEAGERAELEAERDQAQID